MRTTFGIKNMQPLKKKTVVAIGVFDGVHLGHRMIIKKAIKEARRIKGEAVVLTFDPHPLYILDHIRRPPRLMSLAHKLNIFKELGLDTCLVIKFDRKFSRLTPEEFIKRVLVDKLNASKVLVGKNFVFGKNKKGTPKTLKRLSKKYGFLIERLNPLRMDGKIISSSLLRQLIANGDLRTASILLGRPVSVLGTVVTGKGLGRILGFPTANVNPHHEVIPPSGVYAVKIKLQNKLFNGILSMGRRPTFEFDKNIEPTIEAHIFGFNKNIYGKDLEILFIKKIRGERPFSSHESLVKQIRRDVKIARKITGNKKIF
ncbi:MAG: hypothetical protein COS99_01690 [Candidatus Omnitrophica bacterium CG07_land_8_20_14_0_80_42_15]|uniref:Riboflavin biosynthesis protein n=1 Tax=Candidatus Aquitaenariimonas noxiae TaxID=1974741 RepID=A0A2J0L229_9BACT|nr:MAG: hypothetical protein COS99_01690 [Candidatus Omnitrophica bacterium CG07_land_8_20_14_0_80_42_15]